MKNITNLLVWQVKDFVIDSLREVKENLTIKKRHKLIIVSIKYFVSDEEILEAFLGYDLDCDGYITK